jgi:hypothetical protein
MRCARASIISEVYGQLHKSPSEPKVYIGYGACFRVGVTVQFVLIVTISMLNDYNNLQGNKFLLLIKTNTFCYFLRSCRKALKVGSEDGHRHVCFASEFKITRSEVVAGFVKGTLTRRPSEWWYRQWLPVCRLRVKPSRTRTRHSTRTVSERSEL